MFGSGKSAKHREIGPAELLALVAAVEQRLALAVDDEAKATPGKISKAPTKWCQPSGSLSTPQDTTAPHSGQRFDSRGHNS